MPSALILLHIAGRRRLDQVDLEAIKSAMRQRPRVVTGVTSRFAQAEVLEQLLEEARVKDGLLRMLLGSFQHDLGNTLASLQAGVAQAWEAKEAQADSDDTGDAEFAELYRTIQLAATVARSGEGMVDIAEGKSPIAVVEPYSPLEVFDQVVRPFVTLRARRRSELDVRIEIPDDLPAIYVDRVAFFRILSNVLHNAFKFTQEGVITVRAAEESGLVTFSVADTGPGIPPADVDSIGRYRFRGKAPAGTGGEGIGLWVTRRLLEAMGGAFRVESALGVGSTFYLGFAASPARLDPAKVQVASVRKEDVTSVAGS
jgi:signal transduction histidine kinase